MLFAAAPLAKVSKSLPHCARLSSTHTIKADHHPSSFISNNARYLSQYGQANTCSILHLRVLRICFCRANRAIKIMLRRSRNATPRRHDNAVLTVRLKWARSSGQCACVCVAIIVRPCLRSPDGFVGQTQNWTIYGAAGDRVWCEHLGANAFFFVCVVCWLACVLHKRVYYSLSRREGVDRTLKVTNCKLISVAVCPRLRNVVRLHCCGFHRCHRTTIAANWHATVPPPAG